MASGPDSGEAALPPSQDGTRSSETAAEAVRAPPDAMSAWQYSKLGGDLASTFKLVPGLPVPRPSQGEVLLQLQGLSVNPVDWKIQRGFLRPMLPIRLPFIPGADVAGVVREVGLGVDDVKVGDCVFGASNFLSGGGYAEYATIHHLNAARVPAGLSADVACCLPIAAGTALQSIRVKAPNLDGSYSGRILVANASGGVGHYAVQIARLTGAHVTATAGARNLELVRSLGAHEVLDYKSEEGKGLRSASGEKFDLIVDGTGTPGLPWGVVKNALKKGGVWVHLTPPLSIIALAAWLALTRADQQVNTLLVRHNRADLDTLARLSSEGKLKTLIHEKFSFDKVVDAWKKGMEGHVVGKLVVSKE